MSARRLASVLRYAVCLACAVCLTACFESSTRDDSLQGPSTETIGLKGNVINGNGAPAITAHVTIRPDGYLMDTLESASLHRPGADTTTDAAGSFSLPLPPGAYLVAAEGAGRVTAMVRCTVAASGTRTQLAGIALKPAAALKGMISHPRAPEAAVYVQVYGLDRVLLSGTDGSFRLAGLPAGTHRLRFLSPDPALGSLDLPPVTVAPGDTADLGAITLDAFAAEDYSQWPFSRAITVRAGAAGAGLAGDVTGFPLLVRLGASDVPFADAAVGGADVRFSGPGGRHLDFEIESWDRASGKAAMWVKLDTIRGGDDAQSIRIHWGKTHGASPSLGRAVFRDSLGFASVWHLASNGSDAGTGGNPLRAVSTAVPAGGASPTLVTTGFDGQTSFLWSRDSLAGPQAFTLSVWVRAEGEGKIIGFENYPGHAPALFDRHIWVTSDGAFHFGVFAADPPVTDQAYQMTVSSRPGFMDGAWHRVVATQSPALGQALYVDGRLESRDAGVLHASAYTGRWVLGDGVLGDWQPSPATTHFRGDLDEARVDHAVRAADWILLDYQSQKPGSTVLAF